MCFGPSRSLILGTIFFVGTFVSLLFWHHEKCKCFSNVLWELHLFSFFFMPLKTLDRVMFFELWEMYFTIIINKTLNNCYAFKVILSISVLFFSFFNFYFILCWENIYCILGKKKKKNQCFFIKKFYQKLSQTRLLENARRDTFVKSMGAMGGGFFFLI